MDAPSYNFSIDEGSPVQLTFVWKNDNGEPIDISGYSVRMQIRDQQEPDAELVMDVADQGYITITDGPNGEFTLDIPDTATEDMGFRTAYYDIELDDGSSSGAPGRVLEGIISFNREVTR